MPQINAPAVNIDQYNKDKLQVTADPEFPLVDFYTYLDAHKDLQTKWLHG